MSKDTLNLEDTILELEQRIHELKNDSEQTGSSIKIITLEKRQ